MSASTRIAHTVASPLADCARIGSKARKNAMIESCMTKSTPEIDLGLKPKSYEK